MSHLRSRTSQRRAAVFLSHRNPSNEAWDLRQKWLKSHPMSLEHHSSHHCRQWITSHLISHQYHPAVSTTTIHQLSQQSVVWLFPSTYSLECARHTCRYVLLPRYLSRQGRVRHSIIHRHLCLLSVLRQCLLMIMADKANMYFVICV